MGQISMKILCLPGSLLSANQHPLYCDVAVRRWEMATGKTARLESRNQTTIGTEIGQN